MSDKGPFLKLLLAHESDLRAYIGSVVRDSAARDDLYQETALTLWQTFDRYDSARPFGAWARGIATRKMLQSRGKSGRLPLAFSPEAIERIREANDALDDVSESHRDRLEALAACVAALPERSRTLLDLRYGQRLSGDALAQRLDCSRDAVYQSLARLRARLESCILKRLRHSST